MIENIVPETDMDGKNIELKFLRVLQFLVVREDIVELLDTEGLGNKHFYYRNEVMNMIKNNRTTLNVKYNHLLYVDEDLAEIIFFGFYRVRKLIISTNLF